MASDRWHFWIDVGGTFTDCMARAPDGHLLRHKLLSSSVTKGAAGQGSDRRWIVDRARCSDPNGFWSGYTLRLLDPTGTQIDAATIADFDAATGVLQFEQPLAADPIPQAAYEIVSDEDAPIVAIRYLLGLRKTERLPPLHLRIGTTRGTNALLTRRGARTAFVTTQGFADILEIGTQDRPDLFDLAIRKRKALYETAVEIDERVTADGTILAAPDPEIVRRQLQSLRDAGIESLAIAFLHSYAYPDHEDRVAEWARDAGFTAVRCSHDVAPLIQIVARGDTTVVDAYLSPVLHRYAEHLQTKLADSDVRMLTSSGGLIAADRFTGKDSILSGPAGGVIGFSAAARATGFDRAIGFDMGGTSTDVSRFDGRFQIKYETEKAGVRIVAPMMAIETVAAGGGSICQFDGIKLIVGPDSASADPGPACYGRGGPLTVTDLNLLAGKLLPTHFPFPLDHPASQQRLNALIAEVAEATGKRYSPAELIEGLLQIANANMAAAIRSVSVAEGADPRDYVMVAFGGAAGQHACAVARDLGIATIVSHPDAGILSAVGIGRADIERHAAAGVYRPYQAQQVHDLEDVFAPLVDRVRAEVISEGVVEAHIDVQRSLDLRYEGVDATMTIAAPDNGDYETAFRAAHVRRYGYAHEGHPLEIVAVRVQAIGRTAGPLRQSRPTDLRTPTRLETAPMWFEGHEHSVPVFDRTQLRPGDRIAGPAILIEPSATTVIDPGWIGDVYTEREIVLRDTAAVQRIVATTEVDPVLLEIFNNRFAAIAHQMGTTLRNTSSSVNVQQRLDYSCAVFTPTGSLVVNAPHIPVHLGAMSETVRSIIALNPAMQPGDAYLTNDPFGGGSHLPDITVVTPLYDAEGSELLFFTASRAHHAEIGGIRPGSMPPFSNNLSEEGVLIHNFKLIDSEGDHFEELGTQLSTAEYPSRDVATNLADLAAQVAANQQGARDLQALIAQATLPVVQAYMNHIQDAAAQKMRSALRKMPDGRRQFIDFLEVQGERVPIEVAITIDGDRAVVDFTGTGPVVSGNLNANRAIVTAAVLYVFRCLINEPIPLNEGVLAPIRIVLPECLLNPRAGASASECAAVAGGNVETSQRVVDVLLGALGVAAASQGTMNNVLFGDDTFGYYETICGGAGATAELAGADAVHTHMTNTRMTDVEVLEKRYPVRVHAFSIRRGSGGAGRHRGGDGVIRRLEFLRTVEVSILSQRRDGTRPYGLAGGGPGSSGINAITRAGGAIEELAGQVEIEAHAGDVLRIETPGGGGYGTSLSPDEVIR